MTSYAKYLELSGVLALEKRSPAPGFDAFTSVHESLPGCARERAERLFITVHQVFELWLRQALLEIQFVMNVMRGAMDAHASRDDRGARGTPDDAPVLSIDDLDAASWSLHRACEVLVLASEGLYTLLRSLRSQEFLEFRDSLRPASGFQSIQFRLLEVCMGLTRPQRLRPNIEAGLSHEDRHIVQRAEAFAAGGHSLRALVEAWLGTQRGAVLGAIHPGASPVLEHASSNGAVDAGGEHSLGERPASAGVDHSQGCAAGDGDQSQGSASPRSPLLPSNHLARSGHEAATGGHGIAAACPRMAAVLNRIDSGSIDGSPRREGPPPRPRGFNGVAAAKASAGAQANGNGNGNGNSNGYHLKHKDSSHVNLVTSQVSKLGGQPGTATTAAETAPGAHCPFATNGARPGDVAPAPTMSPDALAAAAAILSYERRVCAASRGKAGVTAGRHERLLWPHQEQPWWTHGDQAGGQQQGGGDGASGHVCSCPLGKRPPGLMREGGPQESSFVPGMEGGALQEQIGAGHNDGLGKGNGAGMKNGAGMENFFGKNGAGFLVNGAVPAAATVDELMLARLRFLLHVLRLDGVMEEWRRRHAHMVAAMIGAQEVGTGDIGVTASNYLAKSVGAHRLFADIAGLL